ncbi:hypothetical protein K502DRAFT_339963 [Neoconidiobolus thromboides FSU 785]|nr:hypothetical protein K502DRAFT_339963 [Neoconidiobolus thromboides FSU 785]
MIASIEASITNENTKLKASINHSPTSSTSSGPDTPNSKNEMVHFNNLKPNEIDITITKTKLTDNTMTPSSSLHISPTKTMEITDNMDNNYDLENEIEVLPASFIAMSHQPQMTHSDPIIKLKIRYVAKDLWQTLSFPNSITVSQARDICLLRCNIWNPNGKDNGNNNLIKSNLSIHSDESGLIQDKNSKDKGSKRLSIQNEVVDNNWRGDYSLFWNGAGHWLDDFRRLDSYNLRHLDILELQKKSDFIFIQPSLYYEHYAEGYMYKLKGGISPSWKLRWFIVQGRGIWYFKKKKDSNPAGSADLSRPFQVQETSVDSPNSPDTKESCLILRYSEKCWWLRATSVEELDHWRRILITLNREVNDHCAAHQTQNQLTNKANNITRTFSNSLSESGTSVDSELKTQRSFNATSMNSGDQGISRGSMRIKAGYMFRRAPVTHSFRERYFVLRGKELSCYKSDRFDKSKNVAKVISLHTVEIAHYSNLGKYYFRITDKSSQEEEPGIVLNGAKKVAGSKKGSDFKSILSSTRSLPNKVGSWISQGNGAQLSTEYLYVESREDSESWKNAFESISELEVREIDINDVKSNSKSLQSGTRSINTTKTSSSFWSNLSGKGFPKLSFRKNSLKEKARDLTSNNNNNLQVQPKLEAEEPVISYQSNNSKSSGNRFSQFLKSRAIPADSASPKGISKNNLPPYLMANIHSSKANNNGYDSVDEQCNPSESELSLGLSNIEAEEFINDSNLSITSKDSNAPSFLANRSPLKDPSLTPLDRLLAEDYKERERMLSIRNAHHFGMQNGMKPSDAQSGHSSTPSSHSNSQASNPNDPNHTILKPKASHKFIWFKKKNRRDD